MRFFRNILGCFVFDENYTLIEKADCERIKESYPGIKEVEGEEIKRVLEALYSASLWREFRQENLKYTEKQIRDSFSQDQIIIQLSGSLTDIDKMINITFNRLRSWFFLHLPEAETSSPERYAALILTGFDKLSKKFSGGMEVRPSEEEDASLKSLASLILSLHEMRRRNEENLERMMRTECPNLTAIAGAFIGAKLIFLAGSIRRLALLPASTIQVLGAEKAFFRHLRDKHHKPPKYGILHEHPLIQKSPLKMHGRIARVLANKISIAVRTDFFSKRDISNELVKSIESSFGGWK